MKRTFKLTVISIIFSLILVGYATQLFSQENHLWGMTSSGGTNNFGVIFTTDLQGNNYTIRYSFSGATGKSPHADLMMASDGFFYGTTRKGGFGDNGIIFKFDTATSTLTRLHSFNGTSHGGEPQCTLLEAQSGKLYGTASIGGVYNAGVIFEMDITVTPPVFTKKIDFNGMNGRNPVNSLFETSDGRIFGMTPQAGPTGSFYGNIFGYDPSTNTLLTVHQFTYNDGRFPYGSFVEVSNGLLYAMTSEGGTNTSGTTVDFGTIFSFDPSDSTFNNLYTFGPFDGRSPHGNLTQHSNGKLYGMCKLGATFDNGTIFEFDPILDVFAKLYNFGFGGVKEPLGSLMESGTGKLYGMTSRGGTSDAGSIFEFDPDGTPEFTKKLDFDWVNGGLPQYSNLVKPVATIEINLVVNLEGPYNGTDMNMDLNGNTEILEGMPLSQPYFTAPWNYNGNESVCALSPDYVDWMLVELRDALTAAEAIPGTMVARQAAFLKSDGQVVNIAGNSALKFNTSIIDNLFIVIHHRNHLSVMTAYPVPGSDNKYCYDFSVDEGQVFGGNSGHIKLEIPENTVYKYTTALTSGTIYYYKFVNGNDWNGVESVPSDCGNYDGLDGYNRIIQVPFKNTVIDEVCYGDCNPCTIISDPVNVTFQVDMSGQAVSPLGVHIAGTFTGWDPSILEMISYGNDIYKITVSLLPGELHKYKFINGNDWGSEEIVPDDCGLTNENNNRAIIVPSNHTTLEPICFGECSMCGVPPENVLVTFRVDMSNETVSVNGVHLAGSFQGWDPSTSEMDTGIWALISGDGNSDGLIDLTDKSTEWGSEAGQGGYLNSDFNMNGQSDNIDKDDYWVPNNGKGTQVPN